MYLFVSMYHPRRPLPLPTFFAIPFKKSKRSRNQFDVKLPLIETENTGNESLCERNNMPDR